MSELRRHELERWGDLARLQLAIARRWLRRGDETTDEFAKFFFHFSGFNALYFRWREIEGIGKLPEREHITNLLKRVPEKEAESILKGAADSVHYFKERRPVQRMDRRHGLEGDPRDGAKWKKALDAYPVDSTRPHG